MTTFKPAAVVPIHRSSEYCHRQRIGRGRKTGRDAKAIEVRSKRLRTRPLTPRVGALLWLPPGMQEVSDPIGV